MTDVRLEEMKTYTSLTFTYSTGPKGVHLRESEQYKKFVEKRLFMVKMKTICYTLSLTSSIMNVMFCKSTISLAVGQKRYCTCKLGCLLLATPTVVLK